MCTAPGRNETLYIDISEGLGGHCIAATQMQGGLTILDHSATTGDYTYKQKSQAFSLALPHSDTHNGRRTPETSMALRRGLSEPSRHIDKHIDVATSAAIGNIHSAT